MINSDGKQKKTGLYRTKEKPGTWARKKIIFLRLVIHIYIESNTAESNTFLN